MNELANLNRRVPWPYFFHGQLQHGLLLLVLVPGVLAVQFPICPGIGFVSTCLYLGTSLLHRKPRFENFVSQGLMAAIGTPLAREVAPPPKRPSDGTGARG